MQIFFLISFPFLRLLISILDTESLDTEQQKMDLKSLTLLVILEMWSRFFQVLTFKDLHFVLFFACLCLYFS